MLIIKFPKKEIWQMAKRKIDNKISIMQIKKKINFLHCSKKEDICKLFIANRYLLFCF